jgi:saccharopine dehydrogenase-like NADP-dependent oxidoreductase
MGDINLERAREVAAHIGNSKVAVERIDASNLQGMERRMREEEGGFDLVVNATLPMFNRQIIQAACRGGANYLDMASNEFFPKKGVLLDQLEYEPEWNEAGLKALICAGGDAGLVNVMAKEAADELDEIDSIGIKDYGVVNCDVPVALWSMRTFLEDSYEKPVIWEDGKHKLVEPFSGEEEYDFPAPLNLRGKVYHHVHEEPMTIPLYIGKPVKTCDFKLGDPDSEMWKFLIQGLGLMDDRPIEVKGCKISPRDLLFELIPPTLSPKQMIKLVKERRIMSQLMLTVDVVGKKADTALHYKMWSDSPNSVEACEWIPGTNDVSWITSIPASIFSLMLLRDQVGHEGIFPPEVFNREERGIFFNGIKEWGIKVHKQVREIL